jgi:PAP2 superfamily.
MPLNKLMNKILPHEIFFTTFLCVICARLFIHTGASFSSILFLLIIIISVAWVYVFRKSQILRLGLYFILMNIIFNLLKNASTLINPSGKVDELLQYFDNVLIGGNMSLWLESYMNKILTDVLAFCYMLFMVQLPMACFYYLFINRKYAKGFYSGLFSIYALGFMGYIFFPAVGPYMAMEDKFTVPVSGSFITDFLHYMYPKGTNYTDVFPSLHCAVSCFILFFDYQYHKLRFSLYLIPCVGLWFSTVYLRYHYFVDCLAGFILALVILIFTKFYMDRAEDEENV